MAKIKAFILFLTASELASFALGKGKSQRQYNEQCVPYEASASCDSSQGLLCLDSGLKGYRCLCPTNKLHAQLFDSKRNSCVGKVLNSCVRGNSKSSLNESLCVDHAECNTVIYGMAVCVCQAGFTEKDDGTCAPTLKYGDACNINEASSATESSDTEGRSGSIVDGRCDEKRGQKCVENKCQCKFPKEQYYDDKERKCITYANGRCSHDGHAYTCVPNANCPIAPVRMGTNIRPLGLPPLPPFLSAFAAASAGGGVDEDGDQIFVMPLRPRFPHPPPPPPNHRHTLHQHPFRPLHHMGKDEPLMEFDSSYDNFDYVARSIFFGNKKKGSASGSSEENADPSDPNQPRCQCLPGFTRTAAGYCMKGYGSKCNVNDEESIMGNANGKNDSMADTRPRELCNADQFLECMDGHDGTFSCQCRNQMNERYDLDRQECVAMVGRRCRPLGNYPKCDKGSECVNGICQCTNGTSLTPMETCAKDYDEKCEPGQCNVWKGLMCHGKSRTCLCLDSYLRYDVKKQSCVAAKGSMCGSVRSSSSWGNNNTFMSEMAYVDCEEGSECKPREIGGKKMGNICM